LTEELSVSLAEEEEGDWGEAQGREGGEKVAERAL